MPQRSQKRRRCHSRKCDRECCEVFDALPDVARCPTKVLYQFIVGTQKGGLTHHIVVMSDREADRCCLI